MFHFDGRASSRATTATFWSATVWGCCLVGCCLVGCSRWSGPTAEAAPEEVTGGSETAELTPVKTVLVQSQQVRRTTAQPATIHAYYEAQIWSKVSGYVRSLNADIGDLVEEGDSLATIAVPEMQQQQAVIEARVKRNKAREQQAASGVELARAVVRSSEAQLAQAESGLNRADASLAASDAEFERTEDLVNRQSLERRVLDEVRKRRDSEKANRESAQSAIQSAEAEVAVAKAKLKAAEADLQAAEAETVIAERELDEIKVLLEYARLKAPFTGLVTERRVDPGDLVKVTDDTSKAAPLFVVSRIDKVRVRVPVPESDAPWVNVGDKLTLSLPSYPDKPWEGEVSRIASALDPSTRTMIVEADVPNPDKRFMPGMFGTATITLETESNAAMLPARAVRFDKDGNAYVYAVNDDQTVAVVDVETGLDDGSWIEIVSGVAARQRVIDAHLKRFTEGQRVRLLTN